MKKTFSIDFTDGGYECFDKQSEFRAAVIGYDPKDISALGWTNGQYSCCYRCLDDGTLSDFVEYTVEFSDKFGKELKQ